MLLLFIIIEHCKTPKLFTKYPVNIYQTRLSKVPDMRDVSGFIKSSGQVRFY